MTTLIVGIGSYLMIMLVVAIVLLSALGLISGLQSLNTVLLNSEHRLAHNRRGPTLYRAGHGAR